MPDGRAGHVTEYDPAEQKLAVAPLPWYTRAIRWVLRRPNQKPSPRGDR